MELGLYGCHNFIQRDSEFKLSLFVIFVTFVLRKKTFTNKNIFFSCHNLLTNLTSSLLRVSKLLEVIPFQKLKCLFGIFYLEYF